MKRTNETRFRPLTQIGRLRAGLLAMWLLVWLFLILTSSCTQTEVEEHNIPPHALKDIEAGFNLHVLANQTPVIRSVKFTANGTIDTDSLTAAVRDTVQTRATAALTEAEESQITNLWIGQYDATGDRLFSQYIASPTDNTVSVKLKQSKDETESHVWFVVNSGDLGSIATEKVLKEHVLTYSSTGAGLPSSKSCGMTGMWKGIVKEGGIKDVTVELTRMVAKITFTYVIEGRGFSFTPTSVALKSVPDKSQVTASATQLPAGSGIGYGTYSGTVSSNGATVWWYLPENMAGTAEGGDVVDSEKKKIGKGVSDATYIELFGDAVQEGVVYKDVSFRFYPGSDPNNYNIVRNSHYTMSVTLVGIDVSDERITVGEIPPVEIDTEKMPAEKGGEKKVHVTARPGQKWSFDMPSWLSALIAGKTVEAGTVLTYQGPCQVTFQAAEANPKVEDRSIDFPIEINGTDQKITITQSGSKQGKGANISLGAAGNTKGNSSFTATKGLLWEAVLSGGNWLDWAADNPAASGMESTGNAQSLIVQSKASNPSAQQRSGKITVKAGVSVSDANYTGLKQEINVTQAGSTVTGSTKTVNAGATSGQTSTFTATSGLNWAASVTNGSWISLTTATGGPTTGSATNITYNVIVNPSSSLRSGEITVRAGDASAGPTGKITVNQSGATLAVSEATKTLGANDLVGNKSTFTATKGLSWSVGVVSTGSWLSLTSPTSGTNNSSGTAQDIIYNAMPNPNESTRQGTITVKAGNAVSGTDAGLTKTITVTQASLMLASIDPKVLAATKSAGGTYTMIGAKGLPYKFTAGFPSWLTVANGTALISGGTTTGSNQQLTYQTSSANPNSSQRSEVVTIQIGNTPRSLTIVQEGSTFSAAGATATIAAAANSIATGSVTATAGLAWTISPATSDGITVSPISGSGDATLTFTGTANKVDKRTGTFTVEVTGASPKRTSMVTATQDVAPSVILGDIEICKVQREAAIAWQYAALYCAGTFDGKSGWRLPTQAEARAIQENRIWLYSCICFDKFNSGYYWCSDSPKAGQQWGVNLSGIGYDGIPTTGEYQVRCVRNK